MDADVTAVINIRAAKIGPVKQPLTVGAEYHEHRVLCSWRPGLLLLKGIEREQAVFRSETPRAIDVALRVNDGAEEPFITHGRSSVRCCETKAAIVVDLRDPTVTVPGALTAASQLPLMGVRRGRKVF